MYRLKKALSLIVLSTLIFYILPNQAVFASETDGNDNQQEDIELIATHGGYEAPPFDTSNLDKKVGSRSHPNLRAEKYPDSFRLFQGESDSVDEITPVLKDQADWGVCWAFSALGSAESSLYKNGDNDFDFSERHLAYFTYHGKKHDEVQEDGTNGDTYLSSTPFEGGNAFKAIAALSRGTGVAWEDDVPYPSRSDFKDGHAKDFETVDEKYHFDSHFQLKECDFLPNKDAAGNPDGSAIKAALQNGTSVAVSYHSRANYASTYYRNVDGLKYPTFYCGPKYNERDADHAVQIVGWDDNISASAFSDDGVKPSKPGAWIIKNSWGEQNASSGGTYFYISYEDKTLTQFCTFIMDSKEDAPRYSHNYQYDGDGETSQIGSKTLKAKAANVFTAAGDQRLDAVAFYTTDADAEYGIQVYTDGKSDGGPEDGTKAFSEEQTGTEAYAGYHTIALNKPVPLKNGQRFSVVLSVYNPHHQAYPVAFECNVAGYSQSKIQKGQSYFYNGSSWKDMMDYNKGYGNICLKAFTNDSGKEPSGAITISPPSAKVARGQSRNFTASVTGMDDDGVKWSVTGNASEETAIDQTGKLSVALEESAAKLTVRAESTADSSVYATAQVTVLPPGEKPCITITPSTVQMIKGQSRSFLASVTGTKNQNVKWSVTGNTSDETTMNQKGELSVALDEASPILMVRAESVVDPTAYAQAKVIVLSSSENQKIISVFDLLNLKVKYQTVKKGTAVGALNLPKMVKATVNAKGHALVNVAGWVSDPPYDPSATGTYTFRPVLGSEYVWLSNTTPPIITVTVTNHTPSVPGGSHSGGGKSSGNSNNNSTGNLSGQQNTDGPVQIVSGAAVLTKPVIANRIAEINASSEFDIALAVQHATEQRHSEVDISLPSAEIIAQLKNNETDSVSLTVKMISSPIYTVSNVDFVMNLDPQILQLAKQTGKNITVCLADDQTGKENYSWSFNGADLANAGAVQESINLALSIRNIASDAAVNSAIPANGSGTLLTFANHGTLPAPARIKTYVGNQGFVSGQTLYLYCYNSELNRLETVDYPICKVDSNGYANLVITHCSQYVLLPQQVPAVAALRIDTGKTLSVKAGSTYVFKITAPARPTFVSGNNSVFKVVSAGSKGNDYFYKVIAVGKVKSSTGFYLNKEKTPRTVATIV